MESRDRIFNTLRDLSGNYYVEGNLRSARRLRRALEEVVNEEEAREGRRGGDVENSIVNHVKCMIFLALLSRFLDKITSQILEEVVCCMSLVLRRSTLEEWELFNDLHFTLIAAITEDPALPGVKPGQEELKAAVLSSLSDMALGSHPRVRERVWGHAYRGKLGNTIYVCLSLVKNERSKSLRLQALQAVQDLGWRSQFATLSRMEQDALSGTYVNFLPGIVQAVTRVATGGDTQGNRVIAAAVDTWTYFVTLVMRDSYLEKLVPHLGEREVLVNLREHLEGGGGGVFQHCKEEKEEEEEEEKRRMEEEKEDDSPSLPNIRVSRDWIHTTGMRLGQLADTLVPLSSHPHWNVRLSMAHWGKAMLKMCYRSLPTCLSPALETLLTLRQDDVQDVATAAVEGLLEALAGGEGEGGGGGHQVEEMVKKKVVVLTSRLPSLLKQEDDLKTLGALRQLEGCMEVLGEARVRQFIASSHASRLLHSLALCLSLDPSDSRLLHQRSSALDPFEGPISKVRLDRPFKHFQDVRIEEVLERTCGLLGRHGDLTRLAHLSMELLHLHSTSTHLYTEVLMLMTLLLEGKVLGEAGTEVEEGQHVVKLILDELLSPEVLGSPLPATPDDPNTIEALLAPLPSLCGPVESTKRHVLRVTHALRLVGGCARLLGRHFMQFLSVVSCPVMEFAGVANETVSQSATHALERIAKACGCADVGELIRKAAPHFWYPLSMRLKRLTQFPAAPLVLQVALRYAGPQLAPYTEELLDETIAALDLHHVHSSSTMLRVLLAYVSAVAAQEDSTEGVPEATATTSACQKEEEEEEEEEIMKNKDVMREGKGMEKEGKEMKEEIGKVKEEEEDRMREGKEMEKEEEDVKKIGEEVMDGERGRKKEGAKESNHGPIARFLLDYHETKLRLKRELEEEEKEKERMTEEEEEEEEEERKNREEEEPTKALCDPSSNPPSPPHTPEPSTPSPPRNMELVVEVVERCSHLLHMGGREGRLLTLEVARWGCRALRKWENLLLPCLHKLWRPMLLCLSHRDVVVATRTLSLISEFVALSGDFLRRRVVTEALPLVLKFLQAQSSGAELRECLTPALKAQHIFLTTLCSLLPPLQLGVREAKDVVETASLYLDLSHPPEVYRAALCLLRVIVRSHPHHVWLALALRRPVTCLVHPSPLLPLVKVGAARQHKPLPSEAETLYETLS